jgi:hypothetical protein
VKNRKARTPSEIRGKMERELAKTRKLDPGLFRHMAMDEWTIKTAVREILDYLKHREKAREPSK